MFLIFLPPVKCDYCFQAPLRESAIDLVCLSLEAHQEKLTIAQAGCRVLSTLVNTMYTVLTKNLDNG